MKDLLARLEDKMLVSDGCWEWTAAKQKGYGVINVGNGQLRRAHRVVYELLVGPLPTWEKVGDPEVDHRCRNRACVRPDHLDVVSHQENCERTPNNAYQLRRQQTLCKNGHELSGYNVIPRKGGGRGCRECGRQAQRRYQERKRGL